MNKLDSSSSDFIGEGQEGSIYLQGGYAIKEFYDDWIPWKRDRVRKVHTRLKENGIPTYDYFEVDDVGKRYRMTDLSNNKKNLVVSMPDFVIMNYAEQKLWFDTVSSRDDLVNIDNFLATNRNTLEKLIEQNIYVTTPGFMFVVEPGGHASMLIADYDDGVYYGEGQKLNSNTINDMTYFYLSALTTVMINFFPSSTERIRKEVITLSERYIHKGVNRADLLALFSK